MSNGRRDGEGAHPASGDGPAHLRRRPAEPARACRGDPPRLDDPGAGLIYEPARAGRRGPGLWLVMPPPGTTSALRYEGRGVFLGAADPDAVRVTFPPGGARAPGLSLTPLAAMRWYGVRAP